MILPVRDLQLLEKCGLHVQIAQLAGTFAQLGEELEQFLAVAAFRSHLAYQRLHPTAVRAKAVDGALFRLLR